MAGGNCNRPLGQRNDRPEVEVSIAPLGLPGTLVHPAAGQAVVLFAHGSGSSRLSPQPSGGRAPAKVWPGHAAV